MTEEAPTIITPTVGRIVWYWPKPVATEVAPDQPWAAIVTYVHTERSINLVAWTPEGVQMPRTRVQLVQEGDSLPGLADYAAWMPYQLGQARKHAGEKA